MNECLNWASLSDKSAVVEALTAEERLFLRSHPNGCAACASELTLWENLGQALKDPERLTARRRLEEPRPLRRRLARFASSNGFQGWSVRVALAGISIALAAGAVVRLRTAGPVTEGSPQMGQRTGAVSKPVSAPITERLTFEADSRLVPNDEERTERGGAGRPQTSGSQEARLPTAVELLERARELRAVGRYGEASSVYLRLVRERPGSPEARVALVSVGELQLSQLGDAAAALRSFEAYLSGGGALRQEASYGRVRALRQLGRMREARAAAAAFMSAYPNSVQAASLRKEWP